MAKKKKTPEELLMLELTNLVNAHAQWQFINENGCQDPFWSDGTNMNLIRNHVIYHRRQIAELCEEYRIQLPVEYYLPVPPEVVDNYMANLDQQKRVERLCETGETLSTKRVEYDDKQLQL